MTEMTEHITQVNQKHLDTPHCVTAGLVGGEKRRLQAETEAELSAFTPAILDRVFRGEL